MSSLLAHLRYATDDHLLTNQWLVDVGNPILLGCGVKGSIGPDGFELRLLHLQVDPDGVFVLPPAAVQELHMRVQPWRAGSHFLYVNAVDVEHRRLINSWLICLNILRPILSKVGLYLFSLSCLSCNQRSG